VPSAAPVDVRAAALDSRSIKVTWNPPPVDKHNGKITKYVIKYQKVLDSKENTPAAVQSENGGSRNLYSSSPPSSSATSSTISFSPSSVKQEDHRVKSTSKIVTSSASAASPAVHSVDNEVEDDYDLDAVRSSLSVKEENADPDSRSHVIRNLEEWTIYRITVSAATIIGTGPPSSPDLLIRTDEFGMFYLLLCFMLLFLFIFMFCVSVEYSRLCFLFDQKMQTYM
jgi:hypothetical protein